MSDTQATQRSGGRPRRAGVDESIVTATLELVAAHGYAGTGLDAIAARARVAKTTIYRRWHSKGGLAIDALVSVLGEPPAQTRGDAADIRRAVAWLTARVSSPVIRSLLVGLVAEANKDAALRRNLRASLRAPFTDQVAGVWGLPREEVDLAFDIVVGAILHRLAMRGTVSKHDADTITSLAAGLLVSSRIDGAVHTRNPPEQARHGTALPPSGLD